MAKQLIPQLRFPEFDGEWNENKLQEVSKIERGRFSPRPRNNPIYYNGKIPFVQTSDVVNSNGKISKYTQTLNEKGLKVSKLFPKGTILITIAANIGYSGVLQIDMACPDSLIGISCKQNTDEYFLNYLFEIEQRKLDYLAIDGAQKNINLEFLRPYKLNFPTHPEQQKIASFLTDVDDKITKLTKKKDLLEQYKKGIIQKIFNQELRFKNDSGNDFPDWEVKKLREVATFFSGGTPTTTNRSYYSGSIPFIGSGNISDEKVEKYITEEAISNSSAKMVEKGDLLYALYGATSGEVAISKINGAINQAILCIRTVNNNYFLFQYLLMQKAKIISTFLQGGQGNLSANIIKDLKVKFPCMEEQAKIANFLSDIDLKIEALNTKIENSKAFKKGLLQQMFV